MAWVSGSHGRAAGDGLSKSYGALKVIDDLHVHLDDGEALGVVGPNGAGKTTMLHLAAGQLRPDAGRVRLGGRDITGLPARTRCQLGLARTYQVPQPFSGMTVYENVLVGPPSEVRRRAHEASLEALELAGLTGHANRLAGSLTLLERKPWSWPGRWPPAPGAAAGRGGRRAHRAGGPPAGRHHQRVRQTGVSIVWIEHIVHALLSVADRIVAINFGRKLIEGDPRTVMASPEVRDVYLGAEAI